MMDLKENLDLVKELGSDKCFSAGPCDVTKEEAVAASLAAGLQKFGTQLIGAVWWVSALERGTRNEAPELFPT